MHIIEQPRDLVIIGLPLRTSAASAAADIPAHWARMIATGATGELFAVYGEYESDSRGAYTMILGTRAGDEAPVPEGQQRIVIPAGRYATMTAEGDPQTAVWQAWNYINTEWPARDTRRYVADYERYGEPGRAEIYVGVR